MIALTETPRTDAALIPDEVTWMEGIVTADFARQLERELASLADELRLARENELHTAQQVIEWSQIATEEKKDAARYRFLRAASKAFGSWKVSHTVLDERERPERRWLHEETLDEAIDAALKTPR